MLLDSIIQNNDIQDSFPSSLLHISTHVKWTTFKAFFHSHFIIRNKNIENSFFHLHCFCIWIMSKWKTKIQGFFFFIPFCFFSKIDHPKWQHASLLSFNYAFWILSSKTTLFKAFFHIHFSALDHVKSTTIQAFIHSHFGLGFCHPKWQNLRLFVIFICFAIWSSCKMNNNMEGFFSFTIGIWWNM